MCFLARGPVIGGLLLLVVSPATIDRLVTSLTQHELSEDPHDFLATHLLRTAHGLTGSAVLFGAVYLLAHGLVKAILVTALLKNQLWAYPWTIAFLGVFIVYQLYRLSFQPSVGLTALTIFDTVIASVIHVLQAGSAIELLRTPDASARRHCLGVSRRYSSRCRTSPSGTRTTDAIAQR